MKKFIMALKGFFPLLIVLIICCKTNVRAEGLGRGLGDDIDWKTLENGLDEAKSSNKPLMLIIHKSWCGACKRFRPNFANSAEIKELSDKFVMVNVEDDDEPSEEKYKPDGGYVPRILFLDPNGEVLTDIFNKAGNPNYKYFYSDVSLVPDSMNTALKTVSTYRFTEL